MRFISRALLLEQLKRFGHIMVLPLIVYLLFVIMPIYNTANAYYSAEAMINLLSMANPIMIIATFIVPFVTVMMLFSFHFEVNTSFGMLTLADNKKQLFWTNVMVGFLLMLVPLVIVCVIMLIGVQYPGDVIYIQPVFPNGISIGDNINNFWLVAAFGFRLAISFVFYFCIFLLAFSVSGNRVMASVLSAVFPFVPMMFNRFANLIPIMYVFGYDSANAPLLEDIASSTSWFGASVTYITLYLLGIPTVASTAPVISRVFSFTNPIIWYFNWGTERQIVYIITYVAIGLVLFGIAYICFLKRKPENAGKPMVFVSLQFMILFIFSVTGMVVMGGFMISMASGRWFMYYGFVLGFIICFCVAHMLFEKAFNLFNIIKLIIPSAFVVVFLYATILLITNFFMGFYINYVPNPAIVDGVFASNEARWQEGTAFASDRESIDNLIAFHAQVVGSGYDRQEHFRHFRQMRDVFWQSITQEGYQFTSQGGEHLFLAYRLTNGSVIFRRYALPNDMAGFQPISGFAPEYVFDPNEELSSYPPFDLPEQGLGVLPMAPIMQNPHMVESIRVRFLGTSEDYVPEFIISNPSQFILLIEAIQEDLTVDFANQHGNAGNFQFEINVEISDNFRDSYSNPIFRLVIGENVTEFIRMESDEVIA